MAKGIKGRRIKSDSQEQIDKCLNCERSKCNNCIRFGGNATEARKTKPLIAFREGEEDMHFDSAEEAGDFFHVTAGAIRSAAKYGKVSCDYFWRYA